MVPEKRLRVKKTFYEPPPLPNFFSKRVKYGRNKNLAEWKSIDRQLRREWSANLRRYNAMGINEKIDFARAGYKFPDQPECPAILTATSCMRMPIGSNRGVMAHKLFEALPVGFIIVFSKLEVTSVPHRGDLQACYQVSLYGGKFLLTHTEEMPPHGLAQMVNHPVRRDPEDDLDPLLYQTKQNMAIPNCSLQRSQHPMSAENIADFPAYLKITKRVPKGHEVLYNYGAGHRLTRPDV